MYEYCGCNIPSFSPLPSTTKHSTGKKDERVDSQIDKLTSVQDALAMIVY